MTDDILETIVAALAARTPPAPPAPDNVVQLRPAQQQLVDALTKHLEAARTGTLHSFVGCGLLGDDADLALMFDGAYQADLYAHIGALHAIATRLSELALEEPHGSSTPA